MSKRPDSLDTLHILLALLRRIPRNRKITAQELQSQLLAAGFVRELRTIQRHLQTLTEHFDIECDSRSKPYGYRWKERALGLSLPGMTEQEALLLSLAEQHLSNLLPTSLMKSLAEYFTQARSSTALHGQAQKEREWLSKVRVISEIQPLLPAKIIPGVFEEVTNALYRNEWLEVDYSNVERKRTLGNVMPLGIAQQGPRLYLVCRFEDYDNERNLALHRMVAARRLNRTFMRPNDFDLAQYDGDGRFGFGDGRRIHLSFFITHDLGVYLAECPLSSDQVITQARDRLKVTATVVDTVQLNRWLLSFGDQIEDVKKLHISA